MLFVRFPVASAPRHRLPAPTFSSPVGRAQSLVRIGGNPARARATERQVLTLCQREILQLLAEGRSAKEIANDLAISARTVEFHKYQMMEMNGLRSSAELIHFAIKHGIATI
jgi:DNA-binding CsgD family transcriptional regulator